MKILTVIATLGPVGRLPFAPGTWGSAAAVIIWWFFLSRLEGLIYWPVLIIAAAFAVVASTNAERTLGRDARPIVIDELAGQWLALAHGSRGWYMVLASFLLFRLFDVLKPFPVGVSQRLPRGWGVVVDDLLAGAYSLILLLLLKKAYPWLIPQ